MSTSYNENQTTRISYFDGLRGFAILLVIYGHIFAKIAQNTPPQLTNINNIINELHMPIFFFISGYFSLMKNWSYSDYWSKLKSRLKYQLYPTILIAIIFCIIFRHSDFDILLSGNFKCGYWYTLVVTEMFIIILPIIIYLKKKSTKILTQILVLSSIALIANAISIVIAVKGQIEAPRFSILSLYQLTYYLIFFVLGIIFRSNFSKIQNRIVNIYTFILSLGCFILAFFDPFNLGQAISGIGPILRLIYAISGIIFFINLFQYFYQVRKNPDLRVKKLLEFFGKSTLEIYLIHFIFVEILGNSPLIIGKLSPLCGTWYEFPVLFVISGLIAMCCLAIVKILDILKIKWIIFPKKNKTTIKLVAD